MMFTERLDGRAGQRSADLPAFAALICACARRRPLGVFFATLLLGVVAVSGSVRAGEPPRLAATIMDIGRPFSLRLRGEPEAPFALLLDSAVASSRETRAGTLCLDLGANLRILRDGITHAGPTLDSRGRYLFTKTIPGRSDLLGLEVFIQGVVVDRTAPSGLVLSNCIRRVVGNGSTGDYRSSVIELQWDQRYGAVDIEIGDFDGNGSSDIVVAANLVIAPYTGQLFLFLNDGAGNLIDGTAGETTGIPVRPYGVTAVGSGDVDGDGDLDLIQGGVSLSVGHHYLFINDGRGYFTDGTLGSETGLPVSTARPTQQIVLIDIDDDSDLDAVLDGTWSGPITAWINVNGRGMFGETHGTPDMRFPERFNAQGFAVGDVSDDGAVDVLAVIANLEPALFLNDGHGYFHRATLEEEAGLPSLRDRMSARDSLLADFDRDGDLDCFVASGALPGGPSQDLLLINSNGRGLFVDGTFGPGTGLPLRTDLSVGVDAGDIDRDGDLDLVVDAAYEGDQLLLNTGPALFSDMSFTATTGLPQLWEVNDEIKLADFDGDGDLDIVMAYIRPRPRGQGSLYGVKVLFNE